jgi:16S rRNA (adenine1518-N6/adenine1519-N6)-dimethyltransferase
VHDPPDSGAIDALPPLREVIARFGLDARKSLGQHFLLDLNLTRRIAREADDIGSGTVIEIGPGPGGLTRALLAEGAQRVIAIERDPRCIDALQDLVAAADGRLVLIEADAKKTDMAQMGEPPRRIVANLPYNVATVLLINWLRRADAFQSMTLMFQREVADRIVAAPGSKLYGRLSVMANWRCATRFCFGLPARAFTPPPKVASAVVHLDVYREPPHAAEWGAMETVVAAAFGQRRKMLRSALRTLPVPAGDLLEQAGIAPEARAETLDVAAFAALARTFTALNANL